MCLSNIIGNTMIKDVYIYENTFMVSFIFFLHSGQYFFVIFFRQLSHNDKWLHGHSKISDWLSWQMQHWSYFIFSLVSFNFVRSFSSVFSCFLSSFMLHSAFSLYSWYSLVTSSNLLYAAVVVL